VNKNALIKVNINISLLVTINNHNFFAASNINISLGRDNIERVDRREVPKNETFRFHIRYNCKMQDLNLFIIFARVVEAGSFAEAARRMDISRAAVSKSVAKLEKNLSTRLLLRSTRHLSLTETGIALSEHVARILAEAEHAEQVVSSLHAEPRGTLKVSVPSSFGTRHVAPALPCFLAR